MPVVPEGIDGVVVAYCETTEKRCDDGTVTAVARDGCVVDSEPLAGILIPFIETWARERPATGGQFAAGTEESRVDVEVVTATAWLSAETGVSVRTIRNITARVPAEVELRVVDVRGNCCGSPDGLRPV